MAVFDLNFIAHGGDYNPEQWLEYPQVLKRDVELMKQARVNIVSLGIFAWAFLEPEEGRYETAWLREIIDRLYANGIYVLLATPSGARPAWMSQKYPEVLRVENDRRNHHGVRHNHCFSSPVYREKVRLINTHLAREFGHHAAVVGWHVSNEYSGECHCEYCQQAFRQWLKARYGTLENLNRCWWTAFWSKTFTAWEQLHSPVKNGETGLTALTLSWRRFVSDQTLDFIKNEIAPIREICPEKPVTINTMGFHYHFDYQSFADTLDFFGYDSYPEWGRRSDYAVALETAFTYDFVRGFNGKTWSLMESTPSQVNWHEVCRLKRPGMHLLSSLQAVAHGSDTVMMFQWRKSRGGPEKFHGAVVGHDGSGDARVFRDVSEVGRTLDKLSCVTGACVKSECALIYDQQTRWALDAAMGPVKDKQYHETLLEWYAALLKQGVNTDVISSDKSFEQYKLIIAPYLYMLRPGVSDRLKSFVSRGGTLVLTYMSGLVDADDLCFMGGFPGEMRDLTGITNTETDAVYPDEKNAIVIQTPLGKLSGKYECGFICALIDAQTARTVGAYESDFYAGTPALTVNKYGEGEAWYVGARGSAELLDDLCGTLVDKSGVRRICAALPCGVTACEREKDGRLYLFLMNFSGAQQTISGVSGTELLSGKQINGGLTLDKNACAVIERTYA
ncbi:MAG: beta-galactosidase [Clostridia bacterium]|nr:beta-galactosidase [Clostridia bacterium]